MASSSDKTVFLTGSTGFIGSRVVEILCQRGWNVRALVRNVTKSERHVRILAADGSGKRWVHRRRFICRFSGRSNEAVCGMFGGCKCCHPYRGSKNKRKGFWRKEHKNIRPSSWSSGGNSALRNGLFLFRHYGRRASQPLPKILTEEMTGVKFPDPYYQWKRIAERLLIKSSGKSHFTYSIIRPALVYGPHAEWLVPMLSIIKNMGPYFVPLPNGGTAPLGTVHVDDVASTIALSASSSYAENQIIHAVDNGGTTYIDWFETICKASSRKVKIRRIPESIVYALAQAADMLTSLVNLHFGAYLWAQVLSEGCGYSNEKMKGNHPAT